MSAVANAVPSPVPTHPDRSIDELDAAICRLASRVNAVNYRLLVLVREFDDRLGWAKWSFPSCAEWLSWRCGISLSAAREKVRTAQALRDLPGISLAFREGRLSYTKVRALTRVAALHDEDSLLRYALDATAPQVEERCRQIRNVQPDSVHDARRVWERALVVGVAQCRARHAVLARGAAARGRRARHAGDRAGVGAGEVATELPRASPSGFQSQQADALVAIAKTYLDGGATERGRAQPRRPITTRSSCTSTKQPSVEGLGARTRRSRP